MIATRGQIETASRPVLHGAYVVSGAASGLGLAIAKAISAAGGIPIGFDLNESNEAITQQVIDVTDRDAVERAMTAVGEVEGGLSGVVATAGIDAGGRFLDVSAEEWERVIRVNLIGTANVVRSALPYLISSRGRVVAVASTMGLRAASDETAYCAGSFGVVGFTRALASELAGEVPVTLLIRSRKLNKPDDVAKCVVFALSQPPGCEIREMLVCPSTETSWP